MKDLDDIRDSTEFLTVTTHKEEASPGIDSDSVDRHNLREKLDSCIDPLKPEEHTAGILNIVSGRIGPDSVKVDNAVSIGRTQLHVYESSWSEAFNGALSKNVTTMAVSRKSVKFGTSTVYDTQLIYSRVMGLVSTRPIDLQDLFNYELAPLPTSMFDDNGNMRISTKSVLKNKLQVTQSTRASVKPNVISHHWWLTLAF